MTNPRDPKLEITVPHRRCADLEDRIWRNGVWWCLTNVSGFCGLLIGTYRVSAYQ